MTDTGLGLPHLYPGAGPPLSHFGVTLLRHVVAAGLRFVFHQLGIAIPVRAPLAITALRLGWHRSALAGIAARGDESALVAAALEDPAGEERRPLPPRFAGALFFNRLRLRLRRRRLPPLAGAAGAPGWETVSSRVSAMLPALSDAWLGELVASLDRRRSRGAGRHPAPRLGAAAWAARSGRPGHPERLGRPDPLVPSWAQRPADLAAARDALSGRPLPPRCRRKGAFRELYREALDVLGALYRRYAAAATERGVLERTEDAFFVPFELAEDLGADARPGWLGPAVERNRAEYDRLTAAHVADDRATISLEPLP